MNEKKRSTEDPDTRGNRAQPDQGGQQDKEQQGSRGNQFRTDEDRTRGKEEQQDGRSGRQNQGGNQSQK